MKTCTYHGRPVKIKVESYRNNGHLALLMYPEGDDYGYVITTNLNSPLQSDTLAFLDTNNFPGIEKFITRNHIGVSMGVSERSGFCQYPLFHIFTDAL